MKAREIQSCVWPLVATLLAFPDALQAQAPMGTAFTYQGNLKQAGAPVNDNADFEFTLWDALTGGNQVGLVVSVNDVTVENGLFTIGLDFGSDIFTGDARWLEIAVRVPAGGGDFTTLHPRQELTPNPYAVYARAAGTDNDWVVSGDDMYPAPSGNVGIGTTTPSCALRVDRAEDYNYAAFISNPADEGYGLLLRSGSGSWETPVPVLRVEDNSQDPVLVVQDAGRVGIGTASPEARLHVDGGARIYGFVPPGASMDVLVVDLDGQGRAVYGKALNARGTAVYGEGGQWDFYAGGAGGDYGSSSSIRWKTDIRTINDPLGKLLRLRGVYFNWDSQHGGHHDLGMIAEEVGEVLPEIVQYEENGVDAIGMDYGKLTPLLVEAVKALQVEAGTVQAQQARQGIRLAELEERVSVLESLREENAQLRDRLMKLETMVSELGGPEVGALR